MSYKFVCDKTPQEQTIEQALRRLKYLHAPLVQLDGSAIQRRRKHDQHLKARSLQTSSEDPITPVKSSVPEERFFVSLQPITSNKKPKNKLASERGFVKCNLDRKSIRTGRVPLTATSVPTCTSQRSTNSKALNKVSVRSDPSPHNPNWEARFSPVGGVYYDTVNFFTCLQCFSKNSKRSPTKKVSKEYLTNMNINRITFSARPRRLKQQLHEPHHGKSEHTTGSLLNGWGTRRKRTCYSSGNSAVKETLDLTLALQTLKLDPKRSAKRDISPPEPPPTPISQIDIKLPHRLVVKYNLRDDLELHTRQDPI